MYNMNWLERKLVLEQAPLVFDGIQQGLEQFKKMTGDNTELKTFVAKTLFEVSKPYMPYDTGNLEKTTIIKDGEIKYTAPYAERLYYGDSFNFKTDKHPLACSRWLQVASVLEVEKLKDVLFDPLWEAVIQSMG